MSAFKKYVPRPVRFVELWKTGDWNIKIYSISESKRLWNTDYVQIAKSLAAAEISRLGPESEHHQSGFLTIHIASMFNQIIFDYWARENELRHLVFKANTDSPASFQNITASGEAFCTWELKVISHERDAWVKHILEKNSEPDFAEYYADVLNGMV